MNKDEAKKVFGENLKQLRIARGFTQDELAKALGYVNRSSINKIELGRSDMPRNKVFLAAKLLEVDPLVLLQQSDEELVIDKYPKNRELFFLIDQLSKSSQKELKRYAEYLLAKDGERNDQ